MRYEEPNCGLLGIVDDLNLMDTEVDDYEADFLSSIQNKLENNEGLSISQYNFLMKIKDKYL